MLPKRKPASRRGQITGTQARSAGFVAIQAQIPLAELDGYQGRLKSLTGGQGSYSMEFSHYAQAPADTQQRLASQHKAVDTEED